MPLSSLLEKAVLKKAYDALVIGGGPAGATAATLLAQAGWAVAVVERKTFPRGKVCGEYLSATNFALLDRLGVGAQLRILAGPPVNQIGLFTGQTILTAELPRPMGSFEWGRALSRERLDTLLLAAAAAAGAEVCQPATVLAITRRRGVYECNVQESHRQNAAVTARIVIAAHGSWDPGTLPTQTRRRLRQPLDLLAFKAHFHNSRLSQGLMPLLAFPDGYGGMVHSDGGRVSLSCCIRRKCLQSIRQMHPGEAGDAVLRHILQSCLGAKRSLLDARRDGAWLAAGPIRPGIRLREHPALFSVGNAAGEAHPIIAEGITMAMQSAWLLCNRLLANAPRTDAEFRSAARDYAGLWRRQFGTRVMLSELLAQWAMRPLAVAGTSPFLRAFPLAVTWLAKLSGKSKQVLC